MDDRAQARPIDRLPAPLALVAVWGPGLLVMLADTDAGNIITAAQSGTRWGYRLLPLLVLLIPVLYMLQELTVRLGIFTGRGFGELVVARFGRVWALLAGIALVVGTIGSLITEFTGLAGVGELYGIPRQATLVLAVLCLLGIVGTGAYRRVERLAVIIGLFELAFFVVAAAAHPSLAALARDAGDLPFGRSDFLYLAAGLVGAAFSPWMVFYQQAAVVDKALSASDFRAARLETAGGAVLSQMLTAAVLIAAAATIGTRSPGASLDTIGQISDAMTPFLGVAAGRLIFGAGVVGASLVAAIVCSLAMAWGLGEIGSTLLGRRSDSVRALSSPSFKASYAGVVILGAAVVWIVPDLVQLSIAAQLVNAVLMPLIAGLLVILAATVLPAARRLRGPYLWLVAGMLVAASVLGVVGALSPLA